MCTIEHRRKMQKQIEAMRFEASHSKDNSLNKQKTKCLLAFWIKWSEQIIVEIIVVKEEESFSNK